MADVQPIVGVWKHGAAYGRPPFHPDAAYPETGSHGAPVDPSNTCYGLVRSSLACYDPANLGSACWNPLGEIVSPGQTVVLKPNLVTHERPGFSALTTHAAVIRCLLDYAVIALRGSGRVIVCDAPIQGADFDRLQRDSGLAEAIAWCREHAPVPVSLVDLRTEWARVDDRSAFIRERVALPGDPAGETLFDLGPSSALEELSALGARLAVGDYSTRATGENHRRGTHRYRFSNTVLEADVVLNVAKLKTHQKAGLTAALKNVVGMNTSKDFLPHFRLGPPPGGDEFPASSYNRLAARARSSLQQRVPLSLWRGLRRAAEAFQGVLRRRRGGDARYGLLSGSWEGNDTIWRMVIDINRIARFGSRDGALDGTPRRTLYHFVDGIVAGEGEGPLRSTPAPLGVFLHGTDAVATDALAAALMGIDPLQVPLLREAFSPRHRLTAAGGPGGVRLLGNRELVERLRDGHHARCTCPRGWPSLAGSVPPDLLKAIAGAATLLPDARISQRDGR